MQQTYKDDQQQVSHILGLPKVAFLFTFAGKLSNYLSKSHIFPNAKTCIPITTFPKEHAQAIDRACEYYSPFITPILFSWITANSRAQSRFIFPVDHVVHLPNAVP